MELLLAGLLGAATYRCAQIVWTVYQQPVSTDEDSSPLIDITDH